MRRKVFSGRASKKTTLAELDGVAKAFAAFRPAHEVLTKVRAVPSILVQYDHATRVGGHPVERVTLVHGPSNEGKTTFLLGLMISFLRLGHPVLFLDVEETTPKEWIRTLIGEEDYESLIASPTSLFKASRPDTYEEARNDVRKFCQILTRLREKNESATGLIVVDSIRKLTLGDVWAKVMAEKADPKAKMKDRAAQMKAAANAAWMDEVVPLLSRSGAGMCIVAREMDDPDADPRAKKYGGGYKVGGGKAIYYDASLVIRISRQRYVQKENGESVAPTIYGERHKISISKTKVAGKEGVKATIAFFHTSQGILTPPGFDRARDVLDLARREAFGIVRAPGQKNGKKKVAGGGWLVWRNQRWQGEHAAVKKLAGDPTLLAALEAEVRAKFEAVQETDDDEAA